MSIKEAWVWRASWKRIPSSPTQKGDSNHIRLWKLYHKSNNYQHNGYDQLQGDWLLFYKVAKDFTHRVKADYRQDFVTFLVDRLPWRAQAVTESIVHIIELGLFVLIVWRLFVFGHYMQVGHEGTATIRIPLYPFGYGMAVALIPFCLVIILRLVNSLARAVRR